MLVQSTGGLYESHQARTQCVRMLESGPAAGVVARRRFAARSASPTPSPSTWEAPRRRRSHLPGRSAYDRGALIGGYAQALPVQIPMMDIFEVGTGAAASRRGRERRTQVGPEARARTPVRPATRWAALRPR